MSRKRNSLVVVMLITVASVMTSMAQAGPSQIRSIAERRQHPSNQVFLSRHLQSTLHHHSGRSGHLLLEMLHR